MVSCYGSPRKLIYPLYILTLVTIWFWSATDLLWIFILMDVILCGLPPSHLCHIPCIRVIAWKLPLFPWGWPEPKDVSQSVVFSKLLLGQGLVFLFLEINLFFHLIFFPRKNYNSYLLITDYISSYELKTLWCRSHLCFRLCYLETHLVIHSKKSITSRISSIYKLFKSKLYWRLS